KGRAGCASRPALEPEGLRGRGGGVRRLPRRARDEARGADHRPGRDAAGRVDLPRRNEVRARARAGIRRRAGRNLGRVGRDGRRGPADGPRRRSKGTIRRRLLPLRYRPGGCSVTPVVGIILGSKSDLPLMESCVKVLEDLGLTHELKVCSAHRNPRGVMEWATSARSRGLKVVVAAAGGAAHLPGVVAAWTDLPVIGVPVPTQHLGGLDSLYSIVQMPAGVPVATVAIGEAGAKNAAWLAARIIGLLDEAVASTHAEKRAALAGLWRRKRGAAGSSSGPRFRIRRVASCSRPA